jgi:hypothetical protein
MKFLLIGYIIFLNSALGFCQEAEFSLKKSLYKFPDCTEGAILEHSYSITNTGNSPLLIFDFKVQCSCTKVILPDKPIDPGKTGTIKIIFDSEGKSFQQNREVILQTNTKNKSEKIRFKVFVEPKA